MARKATGQELIKRAHEILKQAKSGDEIRRCQAVLFPLELGISLKETAKFIGRSLSWANKARNSFIKNAGLVTGPGSGGRRRNNLSLKDEVELLEPFIEKAKSGGILVVASIHEALEKRLGRKVSRASAYNLLHRHNWRKHAPDKRHVKADPEAQEEWKKNCRKS